MDAGSIVTSPVSSPACGASTHQATAPPAALQGRAQEFISPSMPNTRLKP